MSTYHEAFHYAMHILHYAEFISSNLYYCILFYSIPLACAECDNSLPFSGASSIPPCHILLTATLLHQLFSTLPHFILLSTLWSTYLVLLFPNSYTILVREFYFLPLSVHVQTNTIYVALLSLLW
jgi:hypothetical protein